MRFDLFQQAELFELFDDSFTGGETLHATVSGRDFTAAGVSHFAVGIKHFGFGTDVAVEVHDVNHGQLVAFTDFIVIEVMCGVIFTQPVPFPYQRVHHRGSECGG